MKANSLISVLAVVIAALLISFLGPSRVAEAAPTATVSRYMSTVHNLTLYNLGCDSGTAEEDGATILAYGQPDWNGTVYGVWHFGNQFASANEVGAAAKSWASGYWNCSPNWSVIKLVIGTSNYQGYTDYGHGMAWADMVDDVNAFIMTPPSWASQITARGGSDMETDWNSPTNTINWVDGYDTAGQYPVYDFGDAGGCAPYGSCNNGWSQDDVWQVSYGFTLAYPFPEIYCEVCYTGDTNGGNAAQWYELSLYSYLTYSYPMNMLGSLTQWAAAGSCCTNPPSDGWDQLYDALNADWRTAQSLTYSSDITW